LKTPFTFSFASFSLEMKWIREYIPAHQRAMEVRCKDVLKDHRVKVSTFPGNRG
jgi:hypothetical protein